MKSFGEFVDKKARETQKQLELIHKLLERGGFKVKEHLHEGDPFIYVEDSGKQSSFGGVRIYKIGDSISFRIQKEEKTHPYGRAYLLDIEAMFKDLTSDDYTEGEAGKKVIEAVRQEIRLFFNKSAAAEKEIRASEFDRDDAATMAGDLGNDYSSLIQGGK